MKDDAALRDLLFLDLALEALFRQAIEKQELGSLPTEKVQKFLEFAMRQALLTVAMKSCVSVQSIGQRFRGPLAPRTAGRHTRQRGQPSGPRCSEYLKQDLQ